MSYDPAALIEFLEDAQRSIRDDSAAHWIRSAIRHLATGNQPRQIAAAASCLEEAARLTPDTQLRIWLRSMASHLAKEIWR
jgi:hypothetical protein